MEPEAHVEWTAGDKWGQAGGGQAADEQQSMDLGQLGFGCLRTAGVLGGAEPGQLHQQGRDAGGQRPLSPLPPQHLLVCMLPCRATAPSSPEPGRTAWGRVFKPQMAPEASGLGSRLPALPNPGGSQGPVPSSEFHRGRPGRVSSTPGPPEGVQVGSRFMEPLGSPGCGTLPPCLPVLTFPAACRLPSFCCT